MRHKNVKFEIKFIETHNKPEWFLRISPLGNVYLKIILLCYTRIDNWWRKYLFKNNYKVVLSESTAIMEYIDEITHPKLMPDDPL